MSKDIENMSVREYNEMLKKNRVVNEEEIVDYITVYTPEEFARETIEHWDEYEGLCRQPTDEEIEAWLERHKK